MKKNQILETLDGYKSQIEALRVGFNKIALPAILPGARSWKNQTIDPQPFEQAFLAYKEGYQQLNELKEKLNLLIRNARFREAIIKTGNVKKQIMNEISILLLLREELTNKLQQVVDCYQQHKYKLIETDLQKLVDSMNELVNILQTSYDAEKNKPNLIDQLQNSIIPADRYQLENYRETRILMTVADNIGKKNDKNNDNDVLNENEQLRKENKNLVEKLQLLTTRLEAIEKEIGLDAKKAAQTPKSTLF